MRKAPTIWYKIASSELRCILHPSTEEAISVNRTYPRTVAVCYHRKDHITAIKMAA